MSFVEKSPIRALWRINASELSEAVSLGRGRTGFMYTLASVLIFVITPPFGEQVETGRAPDDPWPARSGVDGKPMMQVEHRLNLLLAGAAGPSPPKGMRALVAMIASGCGGRSIRRYVARKERRWECGFSAIVLAV